MTIPRQQTNQQDFARAAEEASTRLREWVSGRIQKMVDANLEADRASAEWNRRSKELDQLCAARGLNPAQIRLERGRDADLEDAFSKWSFWEREMKRHAAAIEAMKASRELLGAPVAIRRF